MRKEILELQNRLNGLINPVIIASVIEGFIYQELRWSKVSLYEAYLIHFEALRFRRLGYTQKSWHSRVHISTCLSLLNQKLLADMFGESAGSNTLRSWATESYCLNEDKRKHYIMDRFEEFLNASECPVLLERLVDVRYHYNELSFDDGPYHNESFPAQFYSPEEILLDKEMTMSFRNEKNISDDIEELIIELSLR